MAAWEQATRPRDRMRIVSKAKDDANREFTSVSERTSRSGGAIGHVDLTHSLSVSEPDKG